MAEKKKEKAGDRVAILDAGTPYAKRLDRACRELNVETVVIPLETPAPSLKQRGYKWETVKNLVKTELKFL